MFLTFPDALLCFVHDIDSSPLKLKKDTKKDIKDLATTLEKYANFLKDTDNSMLQRREAIDPPRTVCNILAYNLYIYIYIS